MYSVDILRRGKKFISLWNWYGMIDLGMITYPNPKSDCSVNQILTMNPILILTKTSWLTEVYNV